MMNFLSTITAVLASRRFWHSPNSVPPVTS